MPEPTPIYDEMKAAYNAARIVDAVLATPGGQRWLDAQMAAVDLVEEISRLRAWMRHPATRAKYGSTS